MGTTIAQEARKPKWGPMAIERSFTSEAKVGEFRGRFRTFWPVRRGHVALAQHWWAPRRATSRGRHRACSPDRACAGVRPKGARENGPPQVRQWFGVTLASAQAGNCGVDSEQNCGSRSPSTRSPSTRAVAEATLAFATSERANIVGARSNESQLVRSSKLREPVLQRERSEKSGRAPAVRHTTATSTRRRSGLRIRCCCACQHGRRRNGTGDCTVRTKTRAFETLVIVLAIPRPR